MSQEPYILITADTHAGASHAGYREYLDPQWREAFDEWRGGYKNPSQEHYGSKKMRNWDYGIRNKDQDSQGVVGEVVFPQHRAAVLSQEYRHRASAEAGRLSAMPGRHPCAQSLAEGFLRRGSSSPRRDRIDPAQ